jgi:hypothetical protein
MRFGTCCHIGGGLYGVVACGPIDELAVVCIGSRGLVIMKPLPVHPITGESAARVLLLLIVRILAIAGIVMSVGVIIILLEPIILLTTSDARMVAIVNWQGFGVPAFSVPPQHDVLHRRDRRAAAAGFVGRGIVATAVGESRDDLVRDRDGRAPLRAALLPAAVLVHYGKLKPNAEPNLINSVRDVAIYIAVAVTSMIYPALVIVVMRHPAVVAAVPEGWHWV